MNGPSNPFSEKLHAMKYRGEGESFREGGNRLASALKDDDKHYHEFREILLDMRFWPAGRVQAAMGSAKSVTPYNCFVSGTIEDSFVHGSGSIMDRAKEAATTMRMGGGIGYDFSTLRPRGASIKKLGTRSSGAVSFMDIYDSVCKCVVSAGHRRGAQMGVLRVDHPDVEEFVYAKQNAERLTGFNISLAITDEFMMAVAEGKSFNLRFKNEIYKTVDATALWETIMRSTWDWAEPGVLFIDTINRLNNLRYCETIAATNPCGEQPLPPFGACLLGSFNLVRYIKTGAAGIRYFDWDQFKVDIPPVVRAMDNVVDRASYPLFEQEKEAKSKRRMGLGVMGLANALEALGCVYGDANFLHLEDQILRMLANECYRESSKLALEKGSFELYQKELYNKSPFVKTLDEDVQAAILRDGIRNSHLTSIAPTGTISLCADNVSSGLEPVFSFETERTVIEFDGPKKVTVRDYGVEFFGVQGKKCDAVTPQEHVDVLTTAAQRVDSAVAKTCNVPSSTSWEDFQKIYTRAWAGGAKGCTTYRVGGKREGILVSKDEDSVSEPKVDEVEASCVLDLATGRRNCD